MKKQILLSLFVHALALGAQALVTVGDDNLFAGYLRGDSFVGVNHKGEIKSIPLSSPLMSKEHIEALYECQFQHYDQKNVAFTVRMGNDSIADATCAPAPTEDYHRAWSALVTLSGR